MGRLRLQAPRRAASAQLGTSDPCRGAASLPPIPLPRLLSGRRLLVVVIHSFFYVSRPETGVGNLLVRAVALFWAGVPLFFVISGYCIAASVDAHPRSNRLIGQYFARRFRRIFPPYRVVLAATVVANRLGAAAIFADSNHGFPLPDSLGLTQWAGDLGPSCCSPSTHSIRPSPTHVGCGPVAYCGRLCYSMYLVHWPITKAISHAMSNQGYAGPFVTATVTVPLCLLASLCVASVFHRYIETRFHRRAVASS